MLSTPKMQSQQQLVSLPDLFSDKRKQQITAVDMAFFPTLSSRLLRKESIGFVQNFNGMLSSDAAFELLSLPALDESALQLCAPSTNKTKCNELHTSRLLPDSEEDGIPAPIAIKKRRFALTDVVTVLPLQRLLKPEVLVLLLSTLVTESRHSTSGDDDDEKD
ncbi:unnamed protein product [Sphagnum troendelagicum]